MSGLFEDKNFVFILVNDMNFDLAYLCDVDSDGLVYFNSDDLVYFNSDRSCMFDINSIQLDSLSMGINEQPKNILYLMI